MLEKSDWDTLTTLFIKVFKALREQRAKEEAWVQAAMIRQKKNESLKGYADRGLRMSQLIDTDERYLVQRFVAGMGDPTLQLTLAAGYEDINKATMRELHRKIQTIFVVSNRQGEDTDDGDAYQSTSRSRATMAGAKTSTEAATIMDLEEHIRRIEMHAPQVEVLPVGASQDASGHQGGHQQWSGYGRSRQQGQGQQPQSNGQSFTGTCYNCGKPGHISHYCLENMQGRATIRNPVIVFPGPSGPMRAQWIFHPPNGLAPGCYPIEDEPGQPQQAPTGTSPQGGAPAGQQNSSSWIMEITDVAAVRPLAQQKARRILFVTW